MRIGVIGCGEVSSKYMQVLGKSPHVRLEACTDSDGGRAQRAAETYGIPRVLDTEELLHSPHVDLILNLTPPAAHSEIGLRAIRAGKHYYTEKPLATDRGAATELVQLAEERGLLLGSAPDTFLGSAHQAGRRALESGDIGEPVSIEAKFLSPGYESTRPLARKYYSGPGSGPLFSPGLYFVSSLVSLFGSVDRVYGTSHRMTQSRRIEIGPEAGAVVPVLVDTHVVSTIKFESGLAALFTASFDTAASASYIKVYGTEGTLILPDPRTYSGDVSIESEDCGALRSVKSDNRANDHYGRGMLDMVMAADGTRPNRTSYQFAYHVLDVVYSIIESASNGNSAALLSRCDRPPLREE